MSLEEEIAALVAQLTRVDEEYKTRHKELSDKIELLRKPPESKKSRGILDELFGGSDDNGK